MVRGIGIMYGISNIFFVEFFIYEGNIGILIGLVYFFIIK